MGMNISEFMCLQNNKILLHVSDPCRKCEFSENIRIEKSETYQQILESHNCTKNNLETILRKIIFRQNSQVISRIFLNISAKYD